MTDSEKGTFDPQPAQPKLIYTAFLLRCWSRDGRNYYSLENIASKQRQSYASLESLLGDLKSELADSGDE